MSYNADTLAQTSVLNLVPNGSEGAIWMSGAAPAADTSGNIYMIVANGDFDTTLNSQGFPTNGDCGNCFAKITSTAPLTLLDYFTPLNTVSESDSDTDFGSGGELLLPDVVDGNGNTRHLAVGSGKDANIYVVDRDNMGKFSGNPSGTYTLRHRTELRRCVFQAELFQWHRVLRRQRRLHQGISSCEWSPGRLDRHRTRQSLFPIRVRRQPFPPAARPTGLFGLWRIPVPPFYMHTMQQIWPTNCLIPTRLRAIADHFSNNKFITPMVVNGKVSVGTSTSVAVFG